MEFVLGLFVGMVWYEFVFCGILGLAFILGAYNNSSIAFVIGAGGLAWLLGLFTYAPSLKISLIFGVCYLIVGLIWAMFKWYIKVKNIVKEQKEKYPHNTKADVQREIRYHKKYDEIVYWIVGFPLSMIGFLCNDVFEALVKKMSRIFDVISDKIINKEF